MRAIQFDLVLVVALMAAAGPAAAGVELQGVAWTIAKTGPAQPKKPIPIELLPIDAGSKLGGRLTANLTLANPGAQVEGILIRYSMAAKLAPLEGSGDAVWVLPYLNEERRVPRVGQGQTLAVPVDLSALTEIYLRRVYADGYWPVEFKLQAMLEPRKDEGPIKIVESNLPVTQPGSRARH